MKKKEICIVIPIYKETLNSFEIQSVAQCVQILSEYTINFVCPKGLDVGFYKEKFPEIINFTYFDKLYFENLSGYNRLMLSVGFYKAFDNYQYMLVYQTDCYVFRDELMDWADKGYDYIGGVWFDDYHGSPQLGADIWHAGNGGFSLRKINTISKTLSSTSYPFKSLKQLSLENKTNLAENKKIYLKRIIKTLFDFISRTNSLKYYVSNTKENEDVLFMELSLKYKKLTVPTVSESIGFAWDRLPLFLYNKLGHLPFGCHAWYREDHCYEGNKEFWMQYIATEQSND